MWRQDNEIEGLIRQSAEAFAQDRHDMARVRRCRESMDGLDRDIWHEMAQLGWTGILVPERDGGADLPLSAALVLAELFGRRLLPEPFIASAIMAGTVLAGADATRARARDTANALVKGHIVVLAHGLDEGFDRFTPSVTLTRAEQRWRLTGAKSLVPAWSNRHSLLVTCAGPEGFTIARVDAAATGVGATARRLADGSVAADLTFDSVAVADSDLVAAGQPAEQLVELAIARGLLASAAQLEGLAYAMLRMTIDYVDQRVQFGRPLGSNQALRHALVNLFAQVELAGASWRTAAARLDSERPRAAAGAISRARARCADTALSVAKAAIQYHGAFGYTEEADVGLYVNATLRLASWLGSPATHRERALDQRNKEAAA